MPTLHADADNTRISIFRDGLSAPLVTQSARTDHRPYIHPILCPDGIGELTENQPGHHLWQHGLYTGLNDVNGVGFWKEGYGDGAERDGTFHPQPLAPPLIAGDRAQWRVQTAWHSPSAEPMLTETQRWNLHDRGDSLVLDMEWELQAEVNLRFGAYTYGGLFLRMPWRAAAGASLLTSEGIVTTDDAEGQPARWIALAMPIPGRRPETAEVADVAGIAVMDHPRNPEFPTPWRVDDNYGIAPSRCIAGEWHLERGQTTTSRYRLLAFVGKIPGDAVESEWRHFAHSIEK